MKVASLTPGQSLTVEPGYRFWVRTMQESSTCTIVQGGPAAAAAPPSAATNSPVTNVRDPVPLKADAYVPQMNHLAANISEHLPAQPDADMQQSNHLDSQQHGRQGQKLSPARAIAVTGHTPVIDLTASDDECDGGGCGGDEGGNGSGRIGPDQHIVSDAAAASRGTGSQGRGLQTQRQLSPAARAAIKRAEAASTAEAVKRPRLDDTLQGSATQFQGEGSSLQPADKQQAGSAPASVLGSPSDAAAPKSSSTPPSNAYQQPGAVQRTPDMRHDAAAGVRVSAKSNTPGADSEAAARKALMRHDMPFKLLKVRHVSPEFNQGCLGVTLHKLLTGRMRLVVVMNYMVDFVWLMSACPDLITAEQLVVCHGERSGAEHLVHAANALGFAHKLVLHMPPLPERWGTHHTKAFLVQFHNGVRVIIHTANAIHTDNTNKTQAIWWQDFPFKDAQSPPTSVFETDLVDYCTRLKMPAQVSQRVLQLLASCDMSSARAHLVASVPGRHTGRDLHKYGHMRLRHLLRQEPLPPGPEWHTHSQLLMQCSSLGSVDEKWLSSEFVVSLSGAATGAGVQPTGTSAQPAAQMMGGLRVVDMKRVVFVWPTEQEVRNSLEGWAAGGSIPGPQRNVQREYLMQRMARFGGQALGRMRAMPHIKSYLRFLGQQLAWVVVGSHNLSKAAWGSLEKNGQQLMIRSYAAGRLPPRVEFWTLQHMLQQSHSRSKAATEVVSQQGQASQPLSVPIPLPYVLPPERYRPGQDMPWMVDAEHMGLDILGRTADEGEPLYGHANSVTDDDEPLHFVDETR